MCPENKIGTKAEILQTLSHFFQEIFTSMHDLQNFFKKEKDYIEDLRAIVEKKLVAASTAANIQDYINSFEDVLGDQASGNV
jgi:flagellar biosynthesis chaperone FliJ